MSLVSDTVLSGSARLHTERGGTAGKDGAKKTSQSPTGGLFTPLIQLVKDPLGSILSAIETEEARGALLEQTERKQLLYLRLRDSETYDEWKAAATELDALEGNDAWKLEDYSSEYNAALVQARLDQLDAARLSCDVKRMLFLVRTTLTRGLGGMGDLRLYKHSHIGTKRLIERYIDSAVKTLAVLPDMCAKQGDRCPIKLRAVLEELLRARQSFGRTALLLSGGGTFGMNHIGVVKCLWEQRLLPRIISGASAGSIVCAVLCSKTDAEIPEVLHEFCYGDLAVFEEEGKEESVIQKVTRFLKYGSLFDISHLERVMKKMLGDITFQESYNRTRRILNITVSSASMYEMPRLLNYVSAPDVMIWSAVCASCSVPFVFSAASLQAKDRKTGQAIPWDPTPSEGWIDGSVDNDLPITRLAEMFNVNHFIVSQVNPHVVPFLAKEEEVVSAEAQQDSTLSAGSDWMHAFASFAKGEALHRLDMLAEMGVFPNVVTKAKSVLNQKYSGDITIFPAISYANFPKILSNPTTEYMLRCLLTGERATWPKVSRIQNHVAVELALDEAVNQVLPHVHFSSRLMNLRLLDFERPGSQGDEIGRTKRVHRLMHLGSRTALPTPAVELPTPLFPHRFDSRAKLHSDPVARPYLPTHPPRRVVRSLDSNTLDAVSSTEPEASSSSEENLSGNDESDTTEILSSPSPPHSPPAHLSGLWPSSRQSLMSSSSTPAPAGSSTTTGYPHSILLNHNADSKPSAVPSSPELRYKRLFHPRTSAPSPGVPFIRPDIHHEVKRSIQPLTQIPSFEHTVSLPESQKAPPPTLLYTESLEDCTVEAFGTAPFPSASSPISTRDDARKNRLSQQQRSEIQEANRALRESDRGNPQGFGPAFDHSGSRGMLLRKKQSKNSGLLN